MAIRFITLLALLFNSISLISAQEINLLNFDLDGQDSKLNCGIVNKYHDYTRYLNNMLDRGADPRVKVSSKTALYNLSSNTQSEFQVEDEALEGKKNQSYTRTQLLELLEKLAGENVVFEKSFLSFACPLQTSSSRSTPIKMDGIAYTTPVITYRMSFIERTKISRVVHSNLRDDSYLNYHLLTKPKTLNVRLTKILDPEIYPLYADSVKQALVTKSQIRRQNSGAYLPEDSLRLQKIQVDLQKWDRLYSFTVVEFLNIYEADSEVADKDVAKMNKESSSCGCGQAEEPADNDGDGYSILVDCDDNDPSVYPGAPINIANGHPDDNCDGEIDKNCSDNDGDSFEGGPDCDCDPKLDKKCDCNDEYDDVYPGAPINCFNNYPDDNCDGIPDSLQLQQGNKIAINALDRIYPPWGLTKFGKDSRFYAYTGLLMAGTSSTIYFKIQSDMHYADYKASSKLSERDILYDKANKDHQAFLVSLGSTAVVYIFSQVDLSIRLSKHKNNIKRIDQFRNDCVQNYSPELKIVPLRQANNRILESAICLKF